VTTGGSPTLAAKNATKMIPIVMLSISADPVEAAWLKALPVPAAMSLALQPFPES